MGTFAAKWGRLAAIEGNDRGLQGTAIAGEDVICESEWCVKMMTVSTRRQLVV